MQLKDPHASTTLDAIENMNDTYGTEVLDPDLAGTLVDISAVIGIANALDDPSVSNLAEGYEDLVYLVDNRTDITLPGSDVAGTVGSIAAGLEALREELTHLKKLYRLLLVQMNIWGNAKS